MTIILYIIPTLIVLACAAAYAFAADLDAPAKRLQSPVVDHQWTERQVEMAQFTADWREIDPFDLDLGETRFTMRSSHHQQQEQFLGSLELTVNGTCLQIFDWQTFGALKSIQDTMRICKLGKDATIESTLLMQTVVAFAPRELDMPPFSLHSKTVQKNDTQLYHPRGTIRQTFESPVVTETYFDADYQLDSIQPYFIKEVFNSEPGRTKLIPFIEDWGFTMEWTGKKLLAYRPGHLVTPSQMQEFASLVLQLVELLHEADAACDENVDRRIESATALR